jgi:FkbM family methyltransferase
MLRPVVKLVRSGLAKAGLELIRRKNAPFGYAPWNDVNRLSLRLKRPINCVFDVGANTGQTTTEFVREFPRATIHAFEPHPATYAQLASQSWPDRVKLHPLALSDTAGSVSFYEYDGQDAYSKINSLTPRSRFATAINLKPRELTVSANTLDAFCEAKSIDAINLLKIDTEGHDLFVLKGATRMLSQQRVDFIFAEFNDFREKPGTVGGALNSISEFVAPFGFRFVSTYTDFLVTEGDFLAVASVLMVRSGD